MDLIERMTQSIEGDIYTIGIEVAKKIKEDDHNNEYDPFSAFQDADYLDWEEYGWDLDGYFDPNLVGVDLMTVEDIIRIKDDEFRWVNCSNITTGGYVKEVFEFEKPIKIGT